MTEINDILGFDPSQLNVFNQEDSKVNNLSSNIYKPKPALSKSEDQVYRSTIKVIYSPQNLRASVLERQSYALKDANGWFEVVSSLTNGDTNCPIFKAWKTCHYSKDKKLQSQAKSEAEGGRALFDKRFARYVTIQVLEDNNQPELVGRYMLWKMPKFIWDAINTRMSPSKESKKAAIPVMDFLYGRAIELEVTPGPDDPRAPERKTRETSYATSEITDDIVSCTNPDGSSLLTPEEQDVLDNYIEQMTKRVWKQRDPKLREEAYAEISQSEVANELRKIYAKVLEQIKTFCPDLNEELGYHPWPAEVAERVQNWINIVLAGNAPDEMVIPATITTAPATTETEPTSQQVNTTAEVEEKDEDDDLPF